MTSKFNKMSLAEQNIVSVTTSRPKIWHPSMPNRNAPLGHDYEMNILMLSYLHGWNKTRQNTESFIGAEVKNLYPFEDAVHIEVEEGKANSCFLQAKHCDEKCLLKLDNLLSDSKKSPFGLLKYFQLYQKMMVDFKPFEKIKVRTKITSETHKFVIFTNWILDENDVRGLKEVPKDVIFYMKDEPDGKLVCVEKTTDPDSLFVKAKNLIKDKVPQVTDMEIEGFFDKFVLAVNQPNVNEMRKRVEEELRKITGLVDTEWIASTLTGKLGQWAHQKGGWYLTNEDCKDFFDYITQHLASWGHASLTSDRVINLLKYGIRFRDSSGIIPEIKEFLRLNNGQQISVIYYEDLLLTEIKLAQAIENTKYESIVCDLAIVKNDVNDYNNSLKAFSSVGSNHLMMITRKQSEFTENVDIIKKFLEVLTDEKNAHKRIIFLIPSKVHGTVAHIIGANYTVMNDKENSLISLEDESQDSFYDSRSVIFQDHKVKLRSIMNENMKENINGEILSKLIKNDVILEEVPVDEKYESEKPYTITRTLFCLVYIKKDVKRLKDDFYIIDETCPNDPEIKQEDLIIITKYKNSHLFDKFCSKKQYSKTNIHWVLENDIVCTYRLVWVRSKGSLTKIRKYEHHDSEKIYRVKHKKRDKETSVRTVARSYKNDGSKNNTQEKVESIAETPNRIMVINAKPGMGKSILLSLTASVLRERTDDTSFVIKISLTDHHKKCGELVTGSNEQNLITILEFLFNVSSQHRDKTKMYLEVNNGYVSLADDAYKNFDTLYLLQITTFIYLYNQKKIVVLLDGFDEIVPTYTAKVISILKHLVNSNIKGMYVTTRPYNIVSDLEELLNTFYFSLQGIEDTREILIEKYLRYMLHKELDSAITEERIEIIINYLKQRINSVFQNNKSFLNIPMHITMTADIYTESLKDKFNEINNKNEALSSSLDKLFDVHDIYALYKKYTLRKLEKLIGQDVSLLGTYGEILFRGIIENHQKLALLELFPDASLTKELVPDLQRKKLIQDVMKASEKAGIVVLVDGDIPRFVHRTFAEYFAADLFGDILQSQTHLSHDAVRRFIYDLVTDRSSLHRGVFEFLNYKLIVENDNYEYLAAALSGNLAKLKTNANVARIRDSLDRTPLHLFFSKVNIQKTRAYFQKNEKNMLSADKLFKWTPLHYIAVSDHRVLGNSININCSGRTASDFQDIHGKTPLMLALQRGSKYTAFMFEIPYTYLVKDCDENTILHQVCSLNWYSTMNPNQLIEELLKVGADVFNPNKRGETPFDKLLNDGKSSIFDVVSKQNSLLIKEFIERTKDCNKLVKCMSKCKFVLENNLINESLEDDQGQTALHHAVISCDEEMSAFLLKRQIVLEEINKTDQKGKTPLHYAASSGNMYIVELLLKNNADINVEDNDLKKPAQYIVENESHLKKLDTFLTDQLMNTNFKQLIKSVSMQNNTMVPVLGKYSNITRFILVFGLLDVNLQDDTGKTALHHAVISGDMQMIGILLTYKADVNIMDKNGRIPADILFQETNISVLKDLDDCIPREEEFPTSQILIPLMYSMGSTKKHKFIPIMGQFFYISKFLIDNGVVDVNEKYEGKTPLHYAVINLMLGNVYLLIKLGAYYDSVSEEVLEKNDFLKVIADLFKSVKEGRLADVISITNKPQLINIINLRSEDHGKTIVHYAAEVGNKEIVKHLLICGAFYNLPDNNGVTPVELALDANTKRMLKVTHEIFNAIETGKGNEVQECIDQGAVLDAKAYLRDGMQPLHLAIDSGYLDIIEILVKSGANIYGETEKDENIFHIACRHDRIDIIEYLITLFEPQVTDQMVFRTSSEEKNFAINVATSNGNWIVAKMLYDRFRPGSAIITVSKCSCPMHKDE